MCEVCRCGMHITPLWLKRFHRIDQMLKLNKQLILRLFENLWKKSHFRNWSSFETFFKSNIFENGQRNHQSSSQKKGLNTFFDVSWDYFKNFKTLWFVVRKMQKSCITKGKYFWNLLLVECYILLFHLWVAVIGTGLTFR